MDTNKNKTFNLMTLSPGAERLLLTLIYYAGVKGECFPSQDTLLKALKISRKSVLRRYVTELVNNKLVSYKMYYTERKLLNGKHIPAPQIKYFIVSDKLYITNGDDSNRMYVNFASRELHSATDPNVPVTIHKSYKNSTGRPDGLPRRVEQPLITQEPSKSENPKSPSPYKALIVEFGREYGTNLIPTFGKQARSIQSILRSYSESEMWACAKWLARDKFWSEKGFDFVTIQSQIAKYKMSLRSDKPQEVYRDAKSI